MASDFRVFNTFMHDGAKWAIGEYSNRVDGGNDFANAVHRMDGQQSYALKPTVVDNKVTGVEVTSSPEVPGLSIETLAPELREQLAKGLEWSAKRANASVDEELVESIKEGRNLQAERDTQADFDRMTRNVDFDLEAAYMIRDSLKAEAHKAFDEGRDEDAKAAAAQLAAVKEDIKDYWNPNKERPVVERELTPQQEEDVELFRMVVDSDVEKDAPKLAAAHFGSEEIAANERGDKKAAAEAGEKAKTYAGRVTQQREESKEKGAERQ